MGQYANVSKMIQEGMPSWQHVEELGLSGLRIKPGIAKWLHTVDGHAFINMVSCSYLALNRHPKIVEGAINALRDEGTVTISVSRTRIAPKLLDAVEDKMSYLFGAKAMVALSCSVASAGTLPILASGHFTNGIKPHIVFDKNAHFSMNVMKASCADETTVETCRHNDIEYIEKLCKDKECVAYVTDAVFSMGGHAPISELQRLQDKYGLFLYLDDSHSISIFGKNGVGLARSSYGSNLRPRTIIVASLAKAFGATGGLILFGDQYQYKLLSCLGGPLNWSQMVNPAGLGAIDASADIHFTDEIEGLKKKLYSNLEIIDRLISTENTHSNLPIRVINIGDKEKAIRISAYMFRHGYYCSPVFFPIVAQGKAGLRAMCRSDLTLEELENFSKTLNMALKEENV